MEDGREMDWLSLLWDRLLAPLWELFWEKLVFGVIFQIGGGIRDRVVETFTGNILGLPGPLWAFILILGIGSVIAIKRWSENL